MATDPDSTAGRTKGESYPAGQRLHCQSCGSEVEIINPCTCEPSDLVLQCCGREMTPDTGKNVHVGVE